MRTSFLEKGKTMIRSRRTTKNCDICNHVVATKSGLSFTTFNSYITLRRDCESMLHHTERDEVHICNECWDQMKKMVKRCRGLDE